MKLGEGALRGILQQLGIWRGWSTMIIKKFLRQDQGAPIMTEYLIIIAAIGVILVAGVVLLFNALSSLFTAWAAYFSSGS